MGIPIRRQQIRQPDAATVALLAVGLLLALAAGPAAYWAVGNWRTGSTPPVVTLSPLPNPLETPKASPSPAPTPTPVSVVAGLQGKIAISSGQPGSGGWIRFPGGNFVADPKSNVTLPGGGWAYGLAWNAATNSWVPVNWYMVRQDGQIYAFQTWSNTSATVEVVRRNGTSYLLGTLPAGSYAYSVLSAEPEGVYVANLQGQGGLWLLDYKGGVHLVTATGFWQLAAFGYAYGTVTPFVPQGATNVIRRLDLKTHQVADWFSRPGLQSRVVGTTITGTAIIEASNTTTAEVWLGTQTPKLLHRETLSKDRQIPSGYGFQPQPSTYVYTALGDEVGIWVATTAGLYLWTDRAGWEFASATTGQLASTLQK